MLFQCSIIGCKISSWSVKIVLLSSVDYTSPSFSFRAQFMWGLWFSVSALVFPEQSSSLNHSHHQGLVQQAHLVPYCQRTRLFLPVLLSYVSDNFVIRHFSLKLLLLRNKLIYISCNYVFGHVLLHQCCFLLGKKISLLTLLSSLSPPLPPPPSSIDVSTSVTHCMTESSPALPKHSSYTCVHFPILSFVYFLSVVPSTLSFIFPVVIYFVL